MYAIRSYYVLPCTLEGNQARIDGVTIPLAPETAACGAGANGVLEVGIRPMHLEVYDAPVDDGVPVSVKAIEDLV